MEKKLKINFILKGIAVFAFVTFCLLAILAGVTLPFVSNASTIDILVVNDDIKVSDCATASAEFNYLDYCIPIRDTNSTDTYYGVYITPEFYNYFISFATWNSSYMVPFFNFTPAPNSQSFDFNGCSNPSAGNTPAPSDYYLAYGGDLTNWNQIQVYSFANYNATSPFIFFTQGMKINNHYFNDVYFTGEQYIYILTSIPPIGSGEPEIISNYGFSSRFGNFRDFASTDFYINLAVEPILPEQLRQVTVGGGAVTNGWQIYGQSTFSNIYYFNMFDKFYTNGTAFFGSTNCGWRVYTQTSPEVVATISFEVLDTPIWTADCDFSNTADGGTVTNIRNGTFAVSSNYISDFNVYKISSSDNALYVMNSKYTNIDYVDFLDTFIATQDFQNVNVPSDNALFLKGYQSASENYYNNGYNAGFSVGEKSGYNTGFSAGDAQGYARGIESANTYSFLGLFGAIFDVPIKAIFGGTSTLPAGTTITDSNGNTITLQSTTTVKRAGLLNFDIMGVNLSGFVLALFSLSILVVVIKFALGKGR